MTEIEVIYEKGTFRPVRDLSLKEGRYLVEIRTIKKLNKGFYRELSKLREKSPKVTHAHQFLEEMRNDRY